MISKVFQIKEKNAWTEIYRNMDAATVNEDLAQELLRHFVFRSNNSKRMQQRNNYDGTRTVIFYSECNGTKGRAIYTVKA